ncbi:MAG: zinc ABC transporter ATP-binding protein ZnuC [Alphaproteobacteria bacterium]|nr:MAG: zinc ABC transporter ATP-binding protein ZnuC [Alphaproteobacteria bacterium]
MTHQRPSSSPAAGEPLVRLEAVEVCFGRARVLEHVDLSVRAGEIVSLIGPNGAGKSTLVRTVVGLLVPTRGRVWHRPGLRIGYVPQRLGIDRVLPLTVRRFLSLGTRPRPEALANALRQVEAEALADHAVHDLSGGEFQRVLLARALLRRPHLLVLDEPFQGVDFGGQLALNDLIGRLRMRHGFGVLLVSHDLHIVMAATDRVVCLNRHVCCSGTPEAVSHHPEYVALFGADAARRLAVYSHAHDHAHDLAGNVVSVAPTPPDTPDAPIEEES